MTDTVENYKDLLQFIENRELKAIMHEFGITTKQQVNNILRGKSKNVGLLKAVILKAEENKAIIARGKRK